MSNGTDGPKFCIEGTAYLESNTAVAPGTTEGLLLPPGEFPGERHSHSKLGGASFNTNLGSSLPGMDPEGERPMC